MKVRVLADIRPRWFEQRKWHISMIAILKICELISFCDNLTRIDVVYSSSIRWCAHSRLGIFSICQIHCIFFRNINIHVLMRLAIVPISLSWNRNPYFLNALHAQHRRRNHFASFEWKTVKCTLEMPLNAHKRRLKTNIHLAFALYSMDTLGLQSHFNFCKWQEDDYTLKWSAKWKII